jgi:branched-chain amino acid transport system substrate-binding protein
MTLVLYIPFCNSGLIVSDRLNSLFEGGKETVDKIIKLRDDLIIGFSGRTEVCQNIIEVLKMNGSSLSDYEVNEIIRNRYHQLRYESRAMELGSVEFILVKKTDKEIIVWKNIDGFSYPENSEKVVAIGMTDFIKPQIEEKGKFSSRERAENFGISLIGYVNRAHSGVGSPEIQGCNISYLDENRLEILLIVKKPDLKPILYHETDYEPDISADNTNDSQVMEENTKKQDETIFPGKLSNQIIHIGYISSTTIGLETAVPLLTEMIQPDLNKFAAKLGYNVNFEFLIDDAQGLASVYLEKVQGLNSMGVKNILSSGWSSQLYAALSYCNQNDILVIGNSSTSPLLGIADDNLFRLCSTDIVQVPAISRMIESYGVTALIVIQRGDTWADGIYNYFEQDFTQRGGIILDRIRYPGEATEFKEYLDQAESVSKTAINDFGAENVGVLVISFGEIVDLALEAEKFQTIYNVPWFGTDGTTLSKQLCDDAPQQATHLKIYSTYAASTESPKFNELYDRYYALTQQPFGYYSACLYDAAGIIANAILVAQSYDPLDVIPLFHDIAYNTFGASGWCKLNDDGDRYSSNYQIWSYHYEGDVVVPYVAGLVDGVTGNVTWVKDEKGK